MPGAVEPPTAEQGPQSHQDRATAARCINDLVQKKPGVGLIAMKTAELQSSRNKSSWKWSSSEDGAAGAAQLQEKAQSTGRPGRGDQEPKDTVLDRAAEGAVAPTARGNLGSQAGPQPSAGSERLPAHPNTTALQPEQSHCHRPLHCWAGCPHGQGHRPAPHCGARERTAPCAILQHGAYERPRAEGRCPSSAITTHGGSHKTDLETMWSIVVL